jgi:hypothetical protein
LSRFPLQQKLNINDSQNQNQVGRNDLYITLDSAIVASEAGDKNLEVTSQPPPTPPPPPFWRLTSGDPLWSSMRQLLVGVRDDNGYPVNNCFSSGTGEKPVTEFKSLVLHKCGSPVWKETIRVNVKPEDYPRCHLYFTFQVHAPLPFPAIRARLRCEPHRPLRGTHNYDMQSVGKKGAKVISNGFLRLTNADGTVATDGTKEVATFKPPRSVDERAFYLGTSRQSPTCTRLANAGSSPHTLGHCASF